VWWVSTRWNASRQVRPGQRAQALDILGDEHLVGIQVHDPVAGGRVERCVAGGREVAVPRVMQHARAVLFGDLHGAVGRAGVDDGDLVDSCASGLQAAPEHRLLVLDDHAEAEREALGRAGRGGQALGPRLELAHRARDLRQHTDVGTARALGEVAFDVGQLRVEAARRLEQRLGGSTDRADLVQRDARVVEQHRLARLGLEGVERGRGGGDQRGRARARGQAGFDDGAAGLVAAMAVGGRERLADERAVTGPVAGGQAGVRGGRATGLGGIDET
jgi:hypothetical protein